MLAMEKRHQQKAGCERARRNPEQGGKLLMEDMFVQP
jgi:hypothetical protein